MQWPLAALRHLRTWWAVRSARVDIRVGPGLHVGARTRFWAPESIRIGKQVYVGKDVHVEANCEIGDYCLIANRVAFVGRNDHDYRTPGVPVRFGTWIGARAADDPLRQVRVVVEADCWIGFGAVLMTRVRVGKGAVVAAGSVVTADVPPYAIVAGCPARVVGSRFASAAEVERHEAAIAAGTFSFSERGPRHWIVRPAARAGSSNPHTA